MYHYIEGKIVEITPTYVIVETGGVAYYFEISLNSYEKFLNQTSVRVYSHLVIKSEGNTPVSIVLYGFSDIEEKQMFLLLTSVSGVGNNTARLILSSIKYDELQNIIANSDVSRLQKIKGIGEKTAQRIIVDLKDKVSKTTTLRHDKLFVQTDTRRDETIAALIALGVTKNTAERATEKALKNSNSDITLEELIKIALNYL